MFFAIGLAFFLTLVFFIGLVLRDRRINGKISSGSVKDAALICGAIFLVLVVIAPVVYLTMRRGG